MLFYLLENIKLARPAQNFNMWMEDEPIMANVGSILQSITPAAQEILALGIIVVICLALVLVFFCLRNKEMTKNGIAVIDALRDTQPPDEGCSGGPNEPAA